MFEEIITKYSSFGNEKAEERLYIQTENNIYSFKRDKRSRHYRIEDLSALFLASDNTTDVMLFFERAEDLHFKCERRDEMI